MSSAFEKKDVPVGRGRGYSLLSALREFGQEQEMSGGTESGRAQTGIPIARAQDEMSQNVEERSEDFPTQRPSLAGVPALTTAASSSTDDDPPPPTLSTADLGYSDTPEPISVSPFSATPFGSLPFQGTRTHPRNDFEDDLAGTAAQDGDFLRNWCTGMPPKRSFLTSGNNPSPRLPFTRRSTLADKPELDVILAATKQDYKGQQYLPLTTHTIHSLSPYWKGEKPIADTTIFQRIMIGQEVNGVHADHVIAALERIGGHCHHLLVFSSVQTSDLGGVFNREAGNVEPGNDWVSILRCFPHLKHFVFVCQVDEPVELSRGTLGALHAAVASRQVPQLLESFKYEGPVALLANVA